ncbi:hypothetical protein [Pelobacter propionicus]|uniref:Uncharacterized protein n=1 Tax=Pelobacter propionicus (strain DSM 2379 / NBRC 103807 / OttBd1) TaxID=338966 RepID=A1AU20_PELPD|nr:hypothetical protein [Pelobacter propionicus]ABL00841.1 hypothetical protein Ppro_3247 [Pelobacter propionicus DSM 2379]
MEQSSYRIVLLGVASGTDPLVVRQQLARAFRASPEKVGQALERVPLVVKSGLDQGSAHAFRDLIEGAAGACRVEAVPLETAVSSPVSPATEKTVNCPNCGYAARGPDDPLVTAHGGQGECPACGIIVSNLCQEQSVLKRPGDDTAGNAGCPESRQARETFQARLTIGQYTRTKII